jgi:hypothetical protein
VFEECVTEADSGTLARSSDKLNLCQALIRTVGNALEPYVCLSWKLLQLVQQIRFEIRAGASSCLTRNPRRFESVVAHPSSCCSPRSPISSSAHLLVRPPPRSPIRPRRSSAADNVVTSRGIPRVSPLTHIPLPYSQRTALSYAYVIHPPLITTPNPIHVENR